MTSSHDPYAPSDPYAVEAGTAESNQSAPAPAEAPDEITVPRGTTGEVLEWVGDDKERAQLALDHENATSKPRKGLVDELEEKLAS